MTELSDERPSQAITVLLVEDDAPTSWRLQDALAKAGFQVTAAATLAEARACLTESGPKVLLTDLQLTDEHGVEYIRETRRRFPATEIMVISILGDEESVISAITVGATGYLLKDAFPTDIAATVHELVAGHSPISASIARFIVRRTQNHPEPAPGPVLDTVRLTPREIDILWGIAKGFSYAEIAGHLGLSRQTVPGHIKNIQARGPHPRRGGVRGAAAGLDPTVTEMAARRVLPGRRWPRASRLAQYAVVQLLI